MKFALRPPSVIFAAFAASFLLYLLGLVLPYSLFAHVASTPISFPEIARREPLPAVLFLATFLLLFGLYALVYRTCRHHHRQVSPALILLCGLTLALLVSLTYPVGAGDVVDYVTHGEELFYYRKNPLVVPPGHLPDTAFARYSAYRMAPSNYGPLWTWISALVVGALGRDSLALNLLGFKAVAVLAYLAQALLIYAVLRRCQPDLALAGLAFFAWNPLVLYEFAANGHNDAAMMAFALLGIYFWERRRPLRMTVALTLSFLVKIPTVPLLPLFLLAWARSATLSDRQEGIKGKSSTCAVEAGIPCVRAEVYPSLSPLPEKGEKEGGWGRRPEAAAPKPPLSPPSPCRAAAAGRGAGGRGILKTVSANLTGGKSFSLRRLRHRKEKHTSCSAGKNAKPEGEHNRAEGHPARSPARSEAECRFAVRHKAQRSAVQRDSAPLRRSPEACGACSARFILRYIVSDLLEHAPRLGHLLQTLSAIMLSGALVALAYLSLPRPLDALTNLSTRSGLLTHSLPAVLSLTLQRVGLNEIAAGRVAQSAALGAFALAFILQLARTWLRPGAVLRHAFDLMLFLLLFATPWFQPWYVTWAVALAALFPRPEAPLQAGLFSLIVVFSYVVYGFVWFWIPHQANWGNTLGITLMAVATTYLIPWGYTLRVWTEGSVPSPHLPTSSSLLLASRRRERGKGGMGVCGRRLRRPPQTPLHTRRGPGG